MGHPSPRGFDLVGFCVGLVDLDAIVTGADIEPGDAIVGLPSSGIHSNGLSLARRVLDDLDEPMEGGTAGDLLLEPTVIYVRAISELLASEVGVRGLAHITGEGFLNLLRLEAEVGYRMDAPLPVPRVFELIAERGPVEPAELYEVFNMGCGFCCVVGAAEAEAAVALLAAPPPGREGDRQRDGPGRDGRARRAGPGGQAGPRVRGWVRGRPRGVAHVPSQYGTFRREPPYPAQSAPAPRRTTQAGSHSSPVKNRVGRTRHSAARRHSSAAARGPGRSQIAATSGVASRPMGSQRLQHAGAIAAGRTAAHRGQRRRPPLLGRPAPLPRPHHRRSAEPGGPRGAVVRARAALLEVGGERLHDGRGVQVDPEAAGVEPGAPGASSTSASAESSRRRRHMIPSRSARR